MCYIIFLLCWALFIGFPIVFCLSKSLVFRLPKSRVLLPRFHSSLLFDPLVQFPGSSSTVCANGATFEPVVHTWVPKRLCLLISSGWIPLPSPGVIDSSFHIGWPTLITPRTSHLLADRKLRSREIPFPPQDQSSIL